MQTFRKTLQQQVANEIETGKALDEWIDWGVGDTIRRLPGKVSDVR